MSELPPPPPPFFKSATPGYSVVLPEEPRKSRTRIVLLVVGLLAVTVLVGELVALRGTSDRVSPFVDSQLTQAPAPTSTLPPRPTTTPPTTTTYLPQGGVVFLATRSEVSARLLELDFSNLPAKSCFNVAHDANGDPAPVPIDCDEPHYYQLYAVGLLPTGTEYADVDDVARRYCHDRFLRFVGHWWYLDSHFTFTWNPPDESEYPENRTNYCFLDVPGDYAWIGDAEDTGA